MKKDLFLLVIIFFVSCTNSIQNEKRLISTKAVPLLGWNSYTGYGNGLTEKEFIDNFNVFCEKLQPSGYEYFVIDAGWDGVNEGIKLDEYGRSISDTHYFPNGLKPLIDLVHSKGSKFGIWMARGISRKAVMENLPIYGTTYHAQDIANISDSSEWFLFNYGVDMSKPGAQEYYNSVVALLASWGVDFIKYDDIIPHPDEIEAVSKAIKNCGKDIKLSLSPGNSATIQNSVAYNYSDMFRITSDVWDKQSSIDESFNRWAQFQSFQNATSNIDLDMIPFGTIFYPERHQDIFTRDQKCTFMTQRALASSPLFVGGELPMIDSMSLELITNRDMLECNQKGSIGKLVCTFDSISIWKAENLYDTGVCWIGIFNQGSNSVSPVINRHLLGLSNSFSDYEFFNVWDNTVVSVNDTIRLSIPAFGVVFFKLTIK